MANVFIIESHDGKRFVMYGTTDGQRAIPLFQTTDAAESFILIRGLPNDLHARELTSADIVDWLQNAKQQGATCFVLNPSADGSLADVRYAPLNAAIVSLDLRL